MDALVKVNFSARINFSAEKGIKIEEIELIKRIYSPEGPTLGSYKLELNKIFGNVRLIKKQKELLILYFLSLKETYLLKGEKVFNREDAIINGLGRSAKKVLRVSLKRRIS